MEVGCELSGNIGTVVGERFVLMTVQRPRGAEASKIPNRLEHTHGPFFQRHKVV
jgi:hypothetical protein